MRPAALLTVFLLPFACWAQLATLDVTQIVSRMEQARAAERGQKPAYTVTREYKLGAAGAKQPSSDVLAQVSFVPPSDKQYVILKAEGSERGTGIVRKVLDHEASMASHWQPSDISSANYDFALLGRQALDGHDCYLLQLSPKRQAVELVQGKAWVDAQDFQVRRVDGETAKSPSFWIKQLHVTINYGHVNGVWLETSSQAVADVRLAGAHVLTSKELDVQRDVLSASATRPHPKPQNRTRIVADTAAWVAH